MSLIAVAIFFTCCFFVAVSGYAECGTSIWPNTTCIDLSECPQLYQPIKQFHQTNSVEHSAFIVNHVGHAMCGFNGIMPQICCPVGKSKNIEPQLTDNKASCGNIIWHKSLSLDGMPAELEEFPWLALLEYETLTGKNFGCGGVLISDRHVLTAAHCLYPYGSKLTRVRLGEHDLRTAQDCIYYPTLPHCSEAAIDVEIEKEMPHESYSNLRGPSDFDLLSYDIAVLKLNRSVTSDVIKPICLPDQIEPSAINFRQIDVLGKYISAGWGVAQNDIYPRSFVKLMSRMKEVNKDYCNHIYGLTLHDDIICVLSKSPLTACIADSGGPLMDFNSEAKMTVTGIYSPVNSQSCLLNGVPSTFVDVRRYVDWIRLQMRN